MTPTELTIYPRAHWLAQEGRKAGRVDSTNPGPRALLPSCLPELQLEGPGPAALRDVSVSFDHRGWGTYSKESTGPLERA